MPSTVILINSVCLWLSFTFGTALNMTLIYLIIRYTPKEMRVYSKILLQTCICDLFLLVASLLTNPIIFDAEAGKCVYLSGLVRIQNAQNRIWATILFYGWVFTVNLCMLNPLPQFIHRYLLLNWNIQLSLSKYLLLLSGICAILFIYCCAVAPLTYPSEQEMFLNNTQMAEFLGLNVNNHKILLAAITNTNVVLRVLLVAFYALSYGIICILGLLMHKTVKNRPTVGKHQEKMAEMNRQINKILFIQVSLPLIMFVPTSILLVDVVFTAAGAPLGGANMLKRYFVALFTVPVFFLPAINPAVAIFIYKAYRRAFLDGFQTFCRKIQHPLINNDNSVILVAPQHISPNN